MQPENMLFFFGFTATAVCAAARIYDNEKDS